jgi:uncharacterized protein
MDSQKTISDLKSLEPSLRQQGVTSLYLFGSVARGEASPASDVDLLFEFDPDRRFSLFDQARISRQLSEALNSRVDLVLRRTLHPWIKPRVEAELIRVFG